MKKTFLQRFFLPLCLLTLFGMLGGSHAWAAVGDVFYTLTCSKVNNNSGYADYYNVTVSGMTWNAPGNQTLGDYWRIGGKSLSAVNRTITGKTAMGSAISKVTLNHSGISNTNLKVNSISLTVASDANFTADVETVSISSPSVSDKGSLDFTPTEGSWGKDSYYKITINLTNSKSKNYGLDVTSVVFYEVASTSPAINVSSTSLTFPQTEKDLTSEQKFTLSGSNLSADATLAISGANADMFSVSPTSVSPTDGSISDKEITVTYAPIAAGNHEATLTVSSTGAESKTIALNGTAIAPLAHYTVNWVVNGAAYTEGAPSTDVAEGSKVSALPTTPAAIGDKAFMGWTNAAISGTQDAAPAVLFTTAAEAPAVTANTTYYAVFADATPVSNTWKRIKNLADITEGSYVIMNDAYVLPSTTTGSSTPPAQVSAPEITDENITGTVTESMIWQFTTTSTAHQFFIKNAEGNYLYATDNNNGVRVGNTEDKWTFDVNTADYFSMQEANKSRYCATYKLGSDWRSYTAATHENYRNGGKLELYKYESVYSYSAYATHFATLAERNLAFSASTVETFGSSVAAPTLTGHTDGVTYESSDPEVASVDAHTGAVTVGTKLGTTTIKASAARNENYYADEASYTLSVWPNSIAGLKTLITGTTPVDFKVQLNNAIITYVDGDNAYMQDANAGILIYLSDHGLTAGKSYTGVASGTATIYKGLREITSIDWGTITPVDATIPTAMEVTVADLQDNYDAFESMYVCVKDANVASALSGKNASISQVVDEDKKEYAVYDKNGSLGSTALSSKTAIVSVYGFPGVFNTTYQLNVYNAAAVEETGYNLAVSAAGYATYFNSAKAYTLPAGVKGHIWDLSNALVNTYAPGSVVPANEPLVIEATEGNYALMFTTTEQQPVVNNTLEGTDAATALTDDPSYYYYGLSLNASSELSSVGFYWMNPTGAAFTNGAHKAYLKLAKSNFSPSMVMSAFPFNGSATGIDHIATDADTTKSVYDLSGRRVNKAIKGIYIVNGKKVLVK